MYQAASWYYAMPRNMWHVLSHVNVDVPHRSSTWIQPGTVHLRIKPLKGSRTHAQHRLKMFKIVFKFKSKKNAKCTPSYVHQPFHRMHWERGIGTNTCRLNLSANLVNLASPMGLHQQFFSTADPLGAGPCPWQTGKGHQGHRGTTR